MHEISQFLIILLSTDTRKSPFLHPYLSLPFSPTPSLFWGCASSQFNQLRFQPIHPSTTRNKKASQYLLFYEPSCSDCHKKFYYIYCYFTRRQCRYKGKNCSHLSCYATAGQTAGAINHSARTAVPLIGKPQAHVQGVDKDG